MAGESSKEIRRISQRLRIAGREFLFSFEQMSLAPLWRDGLFWLALGLTIFAVAPFAQPGYFWGANDARHHVYFLFEYDRLVQDGIWWPRWSPDFAFGYGYPFFNIYGPFSHFIAELFFHFGGLSHTGAVETVFCLSIVGSAAAMFVYVRSWLGSAAALVAALVYVYIPYHLLNLYVRANLAESMAFIWLPLCLWAVRWLVLQPSWRWVMVAAVSYAGLWLTSNLVVVLFSPLLGFYLVLLVFLFGSPAQTPKLILPHWLRLWLWVRKAIAPGLGLLAGLGLSAIFWLPMLMERRYVRVDQWFAGRYDYRNNFVYFFQLFSPRWDFGISQAGPDDAFGFQIGVAPLVLALIGVIFLRQLSKRIRWEMGCFLLGALLSTFLALQPAAPMWELPGVGVMLQAAQFPWRWFAISSLCISLVAGLIAHPLVLRRSQGLSLPLLVLVSVILLSSYPYLHVQIREPAEGPVSLASMMRFQQSSDEMTGSTAWVKEIPTWSPIADYYISQEQAGKAVQPIDTKVDYGNQAWPIDYETFVVSSVAHNSIMEEVFFANQRETEQRVVFQHFYYPGWKAYLLDGEHGQPLRELPILPEESGTLGRMTVPTPHGEGYILLRYEDTPPRTIGQAITWATLAVLLATGAWRWWLRLVRRGG
jgi:hypothetical protein